MKHQTIKKSSVLARSPVMVKLQPSRFFFCKIDNFSIKHALFTNNHVLNDSSIELGKKIYFECLEETSNGYKMSKKQIEITEERRVFTNKELDYTCIELFESDGIYDYFQIELSDKYLVGSDIFILQYPNVNTNLSFSYGKILSINNKEIIQQLHLFLYQII